MRNSYVLEKETTSPLPPPQENKENKEMTCMLGIVNCWHGRARRVFVMLIRSIKGVEDCWRNRDIHTYAITLIRKQTYKLGFFCLSNQQVRFCAGKLQYTGVKTAYFTLRDWLINLNSNRYRKCCSGQPAPHLDFFRLAPFKARN